MNSKELKKLGFKEVGSFIVESGNVDAFNASAKTGCIVGFSLKKMKKLFMLKYKQEGTT